MKENPFQTLLASLTLAVMLFIASLLVLGKAQQLAQQSIRDQVRVVIEPLSSAIVAADSLGVAVTEVFSPKLVQAIRQDLQRVVQLDWQDQTGQITQVIDAKREAEVYRQVFPIKTNFDQPLGQLLVTFEAMEAGDIKSRFIAQCATWLPALWAVGSALLLIINRVKRRWLSPALIVVASLSMVLFAKQVMAPVETLLTQLMHERLASIAQAEQRLWQIVHNQGFEQTDIPNAAQRQAVLQAKYPEIDRVMIQSVTALNSANAASQHVFDVTISLDPSYLNNLRRGTWLDFVTLIVVMAFCWQELARLAAYQQLRSSSVTVPEQQHAVLALIRLGLFSYFLTEEWIRPILPLYAASLPSVWLSQASSTSTLIASMPITVFMALVALGQLWLGRLQGLAMALRMAIIGLALTLFGQILSTLAPYWEVLLLGRAAAGAGYTAVFVAAQLALLAMTSASQRPMAFAQLVAAVMAAMVIGPPLGGLLADSLQHTALLDTTSTASVNTPHRWVVASSCVMPLLATGLLWLLWRQRQVCLRLQQSTLPQAMAAPSPGVRLATAPRQAVPRPSVLPGWQHGRFLSFCLLVAMPAKVMMAGLLFFWLPWYWSQIQGSAAETGRVILLFGVLMLVFAPWWAKQARSRDRRSQFVMVGLALSAALMPLAWLATTEVLPPWLIVLALAGTLGLAQSISIAPQAVLVQDMQQMIEHDRPHQPGWIGSYRFAERLGSALGPLLVAALLPSVGTYAVLWILGLYGLCCAGVSLLVFRPLRAGEGDR